MKMDQEVKTCDELKTGEELKTPEEPKAQGKPKTDEELRRAPRLQCSGLAGVQKIPRCEKPCPARIVNLSVGGCLMELQEPQSLDTDEMVELIFNVNCLPFRVQGKVRAIRSERLVGFQFPQLSDRVRRQLEDLIGELIEHLAKLHRESIANRPVQDDVKHPHVPAPLPARAAGAFHPIKPAEVRPGNAVNRPEPHRRWI
jgi:hypothetical protein